MGFLFFKFFFFFFFFVFFFFFFFLGGGGGRAVRGVGLGVGIFGGGVLGPGLGRGGGSRSVGIFRGGVIFGVCQVWLWVGGVSGGELWYRDSMVGHLGWDCGWV